MLLVLSYQANWAAPPLVILVAFLAEQFAKKANSPSCGLFMSRDCGCCQVIEASCLTTLMRRISYHGLGARGAILPSRWEGCHCPMEAYSRRRMLLESQFLILLLGFKQQSELKGGARGIICRGYSVSTENEGVLVIGYGTFILHIGND